MSVYGAWFSTTCDRIGDDIMDKKMEITAKDLRIIANYLDDQEEYEHESVCNGHIAVWELVFLLNRELVNFVIPVDYIKNDEREF